MALGSTREIAGFDRSLIEGILRRNFRYNGKISDLRIDDEDMVVRLYNNEGLDVSIIRKDYFRLKPIIVQHYYVDDSNGRQIVEMTDRGRGLSIVGYRTEDKDG